MPEFDHEMANTRKVLRRIPEDKLGWKVREKSNTIGWVGMHLAGIPGWCEVTLNQDSLDVAPLGGEPYRTPAATTRQAMLDRFDKKRRRRPRDHCRHRRRPIFPALVTAEGRGHGIDDAPHRRAAQLRPESQHPSPGPPLRVLAAE